MLPHRGDGSCCSMAGAGCLQESMALPCPALRPDNSSHLSWEVSQDTGWGQLVMGVGGRMAAHPILCLLSWQVNGKHTLGENIADMGGLKLAYYVSVPLPWGVRALARPWGGC